MSVCEQCGEEKKNLGNHWRLSSDCKYPKVSNIQRELLTGILMGDGCLDKSGANCAIKVGMINEEYLQYVDDVLGNLSNGVKLSQTSEQSAERMRSSGFRPNADASDYSTVYTLLTKRHPYFNNFLSWYSTGEKVFPHIELTPTILKNWYVCDGHLEQRDGHRPRVIIGVTNEYNNSDKLEKMFFKVGVDVNVNKSKNLYIGADNTEKFFDFIGDAVDGFKYKWP